MIQRFLSIVFIVSALSTTAQVKIMSWNVLNFPSTSSVASDTALRCPAYRSVVNYVRPDVLVTMENTSVNSPVYFLNQVMNTGPYHYASGTYINGYDTDNAIYYRDSLFDFVSNQPVHTALRDISNFTLVYKSTGDTLHIFAVHLKASQGYELNRANEVANLRNVTNAFAPGANFLVAGDFNIYNSSEPAYQDLLQDDAGNDGNFLDPIQLSGVWNNAAYAPYHTQSTHRTSNTGGYATGGMNDRFDMILYSNGVEQPTGVYYLPGTYVNVGNDGNHYDDAINYGTNTAVSQAVANALFDASDHLPITIDLAFGPASGLEEPVVAESDVRVYPNPVSTNSKVDFQVNKKTEVHYSILDCFGRLIEKSPNFIFEPGEHSLPVNWNQLNKNGFYMLSIEFNKSLINKKIIVLR
jgi:hypothetical protein